MLVIREADRVATLSLQERADASSALAMHELMIRGDLDHVDLVDMDASEAKKLDASVLQLLVAWCNLLDSRHIPWRWSGVSDAFSAAVRHAGLGGALRLTNGSSDENSIV
jgi:anti-anti-sigma regulatory factor